MLHVQPARLVTGITSGIDLKERGMWRPEGRGPGVTSLTLPDVESTGMHHHNQNPFHF